MLYFKPTIKAVEPQGVPAVKKVITTPKAPRLVLSPNGSLVSLADLLEWDKDKPNRAGE